MHHAAELLNSPLIFILVLVDIIMQHMKENDAGAPSRSVQMALRYPGCSNAT